MAVKNKYFKDLLEILYYSIPTIIILPYPKSNKSDYINDYIKSDVKVISRMRSRKKTKDCSKKVTYIDGSFEYVESESHLRKRLKKAGVKNESRKSN